MSSFWHQALKSLQRNELDIPLAILYSVEGRHDLPAVTECVFKGALGLSAGHAAAPGRGSLTDSAEGFFPFFRSMMETDELLVLQKDRGTFPEHLTVEIQWRGFREPSTTIVIIPLRSGEETLGFLVMGLNPRRAYNEDYASFVKLLGRQLTTSMTSAVLFDQAKLKHSHLSEQLVLRTREAAEIEARFKTLAELNPVGMFYSSPSGEILYANKACKTSLAISKGTI